MSYIGLSWSWEQSKVINAPRDEKNAAQTSTEYTREPTADNMKTEHINKWPLRMRLAADGTCGDFNAFSFDPACKEQADFTTSNALIASAVMVVAVLAVRPPP